jgi:hypothetical protein
MTKQQAIQLFEEKKYVRYGMTSRKNGTSLLLM